MRTLSAWLAFTLPLVACVELGNVSDAYWRRDPKLATFIGALELGHLFLVAAVAVASASFLIGVSLNQPLIGLLPIKSVARGGLVVGASIGAVTCATFATRWLGAESVGGVTLGLAVLVGPAIVALRTFRGLVRRHGLAA